MKEKSGFTLVEVTVVVAIVALLAAIVSVPLINFRRQQALQNTTNGLVALLNEARTKTLGSYNNTTYSVHLASSDATLYTGASYTAGASSNQIFSFEYPVTATWSIAGGGANISFDRLKGTTSQHGTITLSTSSGVTRTITITSLGTVSRN